MLHKYVRLLWVETHKIKLGRQIQNGRTAAILLSRQPAKCTQNQHIFCYSTQTVHRRSIIFNMYIRHNMLLNISDGFFLAFFISPFRHQGL